MGGPSVETGVLSDVICCFYLSYSERLLVQYKNLWYNVVFLGIRNIFNDCQVLSLLCFNYIVFQIVQFFVFSIFPENLHSVFLTLRLDRIHLFRLVVIPIIVFNQLYIFYTKLGTHILLRFCLLIYLLTYYIFVCLVVFSKLSSKNLPRLLGKVIKLLTIYFIFLVLKQDKKGTLGIDSHCF